MLTDTGPLVALLDENDRQHTACQAVMKSLPKGPLQTTWPCFTETMYLLDTLGGHHYQSRLWKIYREEKLFLLDITPAEIDRMDAFMEKYSNVPMDMADASLVAVAELRGIRRVFTIDSDFYIYRLTDNSMLEIVR